MKGEEGIFYDIFLEIITEKRNAQLFYTLFFQKKKKLNVYTAFIRLYGEIHTFDPSGIFFRFVQRSPTAAIRDVFWFFFIYFPNKFVCTIKIFRETRHHYC